jgi:hypothetical protein
MLKFIQQIGRNFYCGFSFIPDRFIVAHIQYLCRQLYLCIVIWLNIQLLYHIEVYPYIFCFPLIIWIMGTQTFSIKVTTTNATLVMALITLASTMTKLLVAFRYRKHRNTDEVILLKHKRNWHWIMSRRWAN